MSNNGYPDDWDEIATAIKTRAGYKCERCGHIHKPREGYTLTTAHLNSVESEITEGNLTALCQRCHLHFESHPVDFWLTQLEMFEPFEFTWLKPHLDELGIPIPDPRLKYQ